MPFSVSTAVFGGLFMGIAVLFGYGTRRWPRCSTVLPRHRIAGEILGVVCLSWAAYYACGMMEGGLVKYRIVIKLLVPVVAVLAYTHLDFLFARAFGGFLLLAVNVLLHGAFTVAVPFRPFYSVMCYGVGIAGLFLVAAPWVMRDMLSRAADGGRWRCGLTVACALGGLVFAVYAVLP